MYFVACIVAYSPSEKKTVNRAYAYWGMECNSSNSVVYNMQFVGNRAYAL